MRKLRAPEESRSVSWLDLSYHRLYQGGELIDPAVGPVRVPAAHVHLKPLLRALPPPGVILARDRLQHAGTPFRPLQVGQSDNHPAQVRYVADRAAAGSERPQERDCSQNHD